MIKKIYMALTIQRQTSILVFCKEDLRSKTMEKINIFQIRQIIFVEKGLLNAKQ